MIHNELRRLTELQRGAKIIFGLDAGESGLERLSESIQVVRNPWSMPEDYHLMGERRCAGAVAVAAGGAGFYSAVALRLLDAGMIMVIEQVLISVTANAAVAIRTQAPALANTSSNKDFLDNRQPGTPRALVQWKNGDVVVPGLNIVWYGQVLAQQVERVDLNYVSAVGQPNVGLVVTNSTANQALNVGFVWRERNMTPGELSLAR